jgi:tRNA dimethylallyltransferase
MPDAGAGAPLLVLAGSTATGKTGLSLALARTLRAEGALAEIISADSRQVFRGLDIGTATVSAADRADVPHHGLDLVEPDEPFSVAHFVHHASDALQGIAERGGMAILVGGTGLYLRAVARGLDADALPADRDTRAAVEGMLAREGLGAAVARLRRLAPKRAARTDLANPRRVARALEIAELAGDAPPPPPRGYPGPVHWLGLHVHSAVHREWIAGRAREQFDTGLVEEAQALRERFDPELPAFSAIGYHEAWAVLDGEIGRETAIERDTARNVAFAKRQATWFRAEREIHWLDATADPLSAALATARELIEAGSAEAGQARGARGQARPVLRHAVDG